MDFYECDLEEIIMSADKDILADRGLWLPNHYKNQVKIGNYGVADIVGYEIEYFEHPSDPSFHVEKTIRVFELKKDSISVSAFLQAVRYIKGIQRYFTKTGRDIYEYKWNISLIGKDVNSDLCYLPDLLLEECTDYNLSLNIFTYKYCVTGIKFNQVSGYKLVEEGF